MIIPKNYYDYDVISKFSLTKLLSILRENKHKHERLIEKAKEHKGSSFIPTVRQYDALKYLNDDKTRLVGFGGGAGGAKTILGCFWIIASALKYPDTRWLISRKTLVSLKQTTLLSFFDVLQLLKIPKGQYRFNAQDNELTFKNNSKVLFKDLDWKPSDPHYTRVGGLELTGGFLDEANEIPEKAIEIILSRIGRRKNEEYDIFPTILMTFNPDKGYVYRTFYEPWKNKLEKRNTKYIPALAIDNPHIPESYIENLWNLPEITKQRLLFGNFDYDDSDDALVSYQHITQVFNTIVQPSPTPQFYIVVDPAVSGAKNDAVVFSVWRDMELIYLHIDTSKHTTQTITEMIITLKEKYNVPNTNIVVDAIGLGESIPTDPRLAGSTAFKSSNSAILTEVEATPSMETHSMVDYSRKFMEYKPKKTQYANLRSQCAWKLAENILNGKLAVIVDTSIKVKPSAESDEKTLKDVIIEELSLLRDKSPNNDEGKKRLISKDEMKEYIGRSPNVLDVFIMRQVFDITKGFDKTFIREPIQQQGMYKQTQHDIMMRRRSKMKLNSSR